MLFNDYPFLLIFLPAALLIYRLADPYPPWRIGVLVLLSFAFYSYGNPPLILLLVLSILINWLATLAYARTKLPAIITAAIVLDLVVLAVFKYANFFAYNLGLVLGWPMPQFDIVLPLGISFFTFHHIMYLVDLRRGKAPFYSLDRYALYISFFPQAIAGPLLAPLATATIVIIFVIFILLQRGDLRDRFIHQRGDLLERSELGRIRHHPDHPRPRIAQLHVLV